jgi:RHS repeat-associated protein
MKADHAAGVEQLADLEHTSLHLTPIMHLSFDESAYMDDPEGSLALRSVTVRRHLRNSPLIKEHKAPIHRKLPMKKGLSSYVLPLLLLLGVAHAQPGKVTYVYTDPQGTPLAEADANGNITATFDYKPYGSQALGSQPAGPGYTGHVNDADTGLVYMQARYYDPSVGRFMSIDPVGPQSGNLYDYNRYAYANGNPIRNIDPDGRCVDADFSCGAMVRAAGERPSSPQAAEFAVSLLPGVGDGVNIIQAYNDPSPGNVAIAVIGVIPEVGPAIADVARVAKDVKVVAEGAAGGERAGKAFTRAGKAEVREANAAMHGGQTTCSHCGRETVPAEQSRAGVTPPGNETHVDHIVPKSKNGNGSPDNGQVLCRDCNLKKSDN